MNGTVQFHEKLAADVVDVISRAADVTAEQVAEVSSAYFIAGEEINERIQKSSSLLKKGLREEAIQECEREPNLLDSVELLDIPDPDTWLALHRKHNLVVPPFLHIQQAAELNTAYAQQVPLNDLLKKHRLLALGHAPINHRLVLLRQIAAKDPSDVWTKDIAAYEASRISEIQNEVSRIRLSRDEHQIDALARELSDPAWQVNVPGELKGEVRKLRESIVLDASRERMIGIANQLTEAYAEFDLDCGRQVRGLWHAELSTSKLHHDDPLAQRAAPALEWLDEQDKQEAAAKEAKQLLAELESGLESPECTTAELESIVLRLSQLEHEIPQVLRQRYGNRVIEYQVRESRAQTLKLLCVAGAIVIAAGAIFAVIRSAQFRSNVRVAVNRLKNHVAQDEWSQGAEYAESVKQTAPAVFETTQFQSQLSDFTKARALDASRGQQFQASTEEAYAVCETIEQILPTLNSADSDTRFNRLAEARGSLNALVVQLDDLAATPEEKVVVATIESKRNKIEEDVHQRLFQLLSDEVAVIRDEFRNYKDRHEKGYEIPIQALQQLVERTNNAINRFPIPRAMDTESGYLLQEIAQFESELLRKMEFQNSLAAVTAAVGNVRQFTDALTALAEKFPNDPFSRQWRQALSEQPIWEEMSNWSTIASQYLLNLKRVSPRQAKQAVDRISGFGQNESPLPAWDDKIPALKAIAARMDGTSFIHDQLNGIYNNWLVRDLNYIHVNEQPPQRYYFFGKEKEGSSYLCVVNPDNQREKRSVSGGVTENPEPTESPQSIASTSIRKDLQAISNKIEAESDVWENHFISMIRALAGNKEDATRIDPILNLTLLRDVVEVATTGSNSLSRGFFQWSEAFQRNKEQVDRIISANWLLSPGIIRDRTLPKNSPDIASLSNIADVEDTREEARIVIDGLAPLEDCVDKAQAQFKLDFAAPPRAEWVGWLFRGSDGKPTLLARDDLPRGGYLDVCVRVADRPVLRRVGRVQKDSSVSFNSADHLIIAGRPVYLVSD